MDDIVDDIVDETWAKRHSREGEDLEENRKYNSNRGIHGEWIHPDRFRYSHRFSYNGEAKRFSCGGKYDPNDVSDCPFCQGYVYKRPKNEVLDVANGIFCYPPKYNMRYVLMDWEENKPARKIWYASLGYPE